MQMRWILTWKACGTGKGRIVVRGYRHEKLGSIRTESLTASKRARQLFFHALAQEKWRCHKADARAAFLQGNLSTASEEIFCEPLPELAKALQMKDDECMLLQKAVYGLTDAPRCWWLKVRSVMSELGWQEMTTEPCVWRKYNSRGRISGLALSHVDDFLVGGPPPTLTGNATFPT